MSDEDSRCCCLDLENIERSFLNRQGAIGTLPFLGRVETRVDTENGRSPLHHIDDTGNGGWRNDGARLVDQNVKGLVRGGVGATRLLVVVGVVVVVVRILAGAIVVWRVVAISGLIRRRRSRSRMRRVEAIVMMAAKHMDAVRGCVGESKRTLTYFSLCATEIQPPFPAR